MTSISFKADLKGLHRSIIALGAKQVPFALALTTTNLAKGVQVEEQKAIDDTFDSPTPFTKKSIAVRAATKARPVATVFPRAIAAQYLAPYVFGGDRSLASTKGIKKGMIVPRGVSLNQYGNLSRNQLKTLQGKPGVFYGKVHTKGGKTLSGFWQRPTAAPAGRRGAKAGASAEPGHLKLLIAFEDTTPVRKHLPFFERAQAYVRRNAAREFSVALRQAVATARR